MTLTEGEIVATAEVLRKAGFTTAWVLDDGDETEVAFLVLRTEGDFRSIQESPSTGLVVKALKAVLPHRKVFLAAFRDGLRVSKLY
jgi:hypothetical protein